MLFTIWWNWYLCFQGSPPTQQRGPVRELGSMDRPHGPCSDNSDAASDNAAGLSKGLSTTWLQVRVLLGEPRLFPRNPWSSWLAENPVGESRRDFRVSANNHGPFVAGRPHRRALSFVGGHGRRHGLPLGEHRQPFPNSVAWVVVVFSSPARRHFVPDATAPCGDQPLSATATQ